MSQAKNQAAVFIVAPFGRDAQGAGLLLDKAGIPNRCFPSIQALCEVIDEEAGALLIAEEAIWEGSLAKLADCLSRQPLWSDLPIIVLTRHDPMGRMSNASAAGRLTEVLGNIMFLERPLHALTMISAVKSGLKARQRQFQLRDYMQELAQTADELRESERRLAESNRELERFATIVSHDLQAPLRKVTIFSDYLRGSANGSLSEESKDYLNRIQGAVERMQQLISDLLALSRVTRKTEPFRPLNLEQVMSAVLDDLHLEIKESGGRVELGALCQMEADRQQMQQLLVNLIGNALKYRKPGIPPLVRVSSEVENGLCRLIVEDNGIGIKEEHQERIFEIFQRLHGVGQYSGTGIGLAIVRRIVDRHGGSIRVESQPDSGARFIVELPLNQGQPAALPASTI